MRRTDPETGLDAVRDVGIQAGRIARLSPEPLQGGRVIDAQGLVVEGAFPGRALLRRPLAPAPRQEPR